MNIVLADIDLQEINFAPESTVVEVVQNVKTILTTPISSVPLDREFGIDASIVDGPEPVAMARLSAEIIAKVHKYEPRAKVTKVSYDGNAADGNIETKVKIKIEESETA